MPTTLQGPPPRQAPTRPPLPGPLEARTTGAVGGFAPLPAHEDHALVAALAQAGCAIARRDQPCVITSARRDCRARHGFGDCLRTIEASVQAGLPAALEQAGC